MSEAPEVEHNAVSLGAALGVPSAIPGGADRSFDSVRIVLPTRSSRRRIVGGVKAWGVVLVATVAACSSCAHPPSYEPASGASCDGTVSPSHDSLLGDQDAILVEYSSSGPASTGTFALLNNQGQRLETLPPLPSDANLASFAPDLSEAVGSTAGGNFPEVSDSLSVATPGGASHTIWTFTNDIGGMGWSYQSDKIAISLPVRYDRTGRGEANVAPGLWVLQRNGCQHQLLARGQTAVVAWNHQGSRLAFVYPYGTEYHSPTAPQADYYGSDTGPVIATVSATGGPTKVLVSLPPTVTVGSLAWSPDGTTILVAMTDNSPGPWRTEIDAYPAAGGRPRVVLRNPSSEYSSVATYTPSGDRILAQIGNNVESFNEDGSNPRVISTGSTLVGWLPQG